MVSLLRMLQDCFPIAYDLNRGVSGMPSGGASGPGCPPIELPSNDAVGATLMSLLRW
jgi:hypothetical protein